MYRKALVNGEFLYFVHAPPQTHLDVKPENKRPKPPDPNQSTLYASVYYYWWAFLRLNKHYIQCCTNSGQGKLANIYNDFGDVRDGQRPSTDENSTSGEVDEFREWWIERGAYLFAEKQAKQNILTFDQIPKSHDMSGRILLSIPLSGNIDVTTHAINGLLRPLFKAHMAQHGHYSRAKFRPEDNYRLSNLHQILKIAHTYETARTQGKTVKQSALFEDAGIPFNKKNQFADDIEAIKSKIVSRSLKNATCLIANVVKGQFPVFADPQKNDFVFYETKARKPRKKDKGE